MTRSSASYSSRVSGASGSLGSRKFTVCRHSDDRRDSTNAFAAHERIEFERFIRPGVEAGTTIGRNVNAFLFAQTA
jgi:hypothetical protein